MLRIIGGKIMKTMSKRISAYALAFLMVLGVLLPNMVSAQGNITELTVDSENFTIIAEKKGQKITVPVYGLTSDYKKAPIKINNFKPIYDETNFDVKKYNGEPTAKIDIKIKDEKDGIVQLQYTKDQSKVLPINIFFDKKQDSATNVTVSVNGVQEKPIQVNPKSYGEDTLKYAPTALGALYQTGKHEIVVNNGFISSIDGIEGKWDASTNSWKGWHYIVNGEEKIQMGPGVYRLNDNDEVEFVYK